MGELFERVAKFYPNGVGRRSDQSNPLKQATAIFYHKHRVLLHVHPRLEAFMHDGNRGGDQIGIVLQHARLLPVWRQIHRQVQCDVDRIRSQSHVVLVPFFLEPVDVQHLTGQTKSRWPTGLVPDGA